MKKFEITAKVLDMSMTLTLSEGSFGREHAISDSDKDKMRSLNIGEGFVSEYKTGRSFYVKRVV